MEIGEIATYSLLFLSLYFETFLLVTFLDRRKNAPPRVLPEEHDDLPRVAIIVPCFNEESTVAGTLLSLLNLQYPQEKLEIIVVDDGSTDGTLNIAREFLHDPRVRVFAKENGGKHSAMNYALAHTEADLIGCLDADSEAAPDALLNIAPAFENQRIAAVTPGIHVKEPRTTLQHMQKVEYRLSVFNRFAMAALGSVFITPGPFSIFRASVVKELGGWRYAHSTEDLELALRIQKAGYLIANAPAASIHTATPRTLRALFRQRVRWTYGFLRNAFEYRSMIGNRAYGNLSIIVLPLALISIGAGIFFFLRIVWFALVALVNEYTKIAITGTLPHVSVNSFEFFYINTSVMWFVICIAVGLVLVLISAGTYISTGSRKLPMGTPLFVLFYSFLVPLWLGTAVVRALLRTGVRWR